jgi:uncharacterized membrane protein
MATTQQTTGDATVPRRLDRLDALLTPYAGRADDVLRIGLGVSFLLGGGFKMLEPAVYQAYLAPFFASIWPTAVVSLDTVFLIAGAAELLFGLLLLARWHVPTVAALTVPWLFGTNVNFIIAVAQGESSVDLLALYIGLMMMAAGVALAAARRESTEPSPN